MQRSDRTKGGRPPYDAALMCRVLVLHLANLAYNLIRFAWLEARTLPA